MFKGVQWKIVFIYSLLVLFAIQFFAVFLTQSLERYYLNTYTANLESQGLLLANFLERYLLVGEEDASIDGLVKEYSHYAGTTDIIVLDDFGRVISSSRHEDELRGQRIIKDEIICALAGSRSEVIRLDPETRECIKYLALPVRSQGTTLGVVYLIGSLEPIYQTLREIQYIFLTGALLVICITVLLGFMLAKTITVPIQEVTSKAAKIARGDFGQRIDVRSQDEIGHLGEMFNYLSCQLEETLGEISSEKGKIEAILNHMTDGIVALNKDGQLLHVNPSARKLLRAPEDAEPSVELISLLTNDIDLQEIIEKGERKSREIALDGKNCLILVDYVPFLSPSTSGNKSLSGVLIILHDVTKERELIRVQQEFVANVSHELRTPLTTLKSYSEALLTGAMYKPDICPSFITTMESEIDRMVRLVKDLLVLSQFDYQQVNLVRKKQRLDNLVEEVVDEMKIKCKDDLVITFQTTSRPIILSFDRDKLKQVFLNLIHNAYKYTGKGGRIDIAIEEDDRAAIIRISDNGIGISAEELNKVFERFYRVDKARSRDLGGTGLGLSIARQIVEAHGGEILLSSEINQGTVVSIVLPYSHENGTGAIGHA